VKGDEHSSSNENNQSPPPPPPKRTRKSLLSMNIPVAGDTSTLYSANRLAGQGENADEEKEEIHEHVPSEADGKLLHNP